MSAIVTPGPQQNKFKLRDQLRDVIRQAGKTGKADRLSRELRERYPNYAGWQVNQSFGFPCQTVALAKAVAVTAVLFPPEIAA